MSVDVFFDPKRVARLRQQGIRNEPRPQLSAATAPSSPAPLALIEECAQLRAEVARLRAENQHLRGELARGAGTSVRTAVGSDDAAQRFALLELDL